jgi:cell division protein WhiA
VEEQAVVKEVRSRANRLANCDQANLRRTSAAASRQVEAICVLERSGRLAALPPALREMADLRLHYPYMNLTELAEAAGEGLTRSAVNHRLRRLVELAERSGRRGARRLEPVTASLLESRSSGMSNQGTNSGSR